MKFIIAGGSGFLGSALVQRFVADGHQVVILSRNSNRRITSQPLLQYEPWDAATPGEWVKHVEGADAVINLAGEIIAGKRWSPGQKRKILESRVNATRAIVSALRQAKRKPSVLISASAVGIYGNVEEGEVSESHPKGIGFLADVCEQWEHAAYAASSLNVRVVLPRVGVVLEKAGGALPKLMLPFKMGVGGWLGSGKQWFPWIHRDDVVNAILFAVNNVKIEGPLNLAAPEAVRLKTFCKVMGKVLKRHAWAPVPAFVLNIALGEMAEILLTGQKVVPEKLLQGGYKFLHPNLEEALTSILK